MAIQEEAGRLENKETLHDFLKVGVSANSEFPAFLQIEPASKEEQKELLTARDAGDENAVHILALRSLRLGYNRVNLTWQMLHHAGLSYIDRADLWQETYLALEEAAKDFKPELGNSFSTLADLYIRRRLSHIVQRCKFDKIAYLDDNGWREIKEKGNHEERILDTVDNQELYQELYTVLGRLLDEKDLEILTLRYGLFGGTPAPQKDVAAYAGISIQAVYYRLASIFSRIRTYVVTAQVKGKPEFPALRAYWKEVSPVDFFYAQMPVLQPDDKDNDDHLDLLWED